MTYMHYSFDKALSWIVLAIGLGAPILLGCSRKGDDACNWLVMRMQQDGVYDQLVKWVDSTIAKDRLPPECLAVEVGTRNRPRAYRVKIAFDWKLLGMDPEMSEIYIGCDEDGQWKMLSLGNARHGVIVSLKAGVPLPSGKVIYKDRRIAVYCDKD